jgi:hypothetical protein
MWSLTSFEDPRNILRSGEPKLLKAPSDARMWGEFEKNSSGDMRYVSHCLVADTGKSLVQAAESLRNERGLEVRRVVALVAFAPAEEEMRRAGLHFLTVHRLNGEMEQQGEGDAWRDLKAEHSLKSGFCGPLGKE